MRTELSPYARVAIFVGFVCATSSIFYFLIIHAGNLGAGRGIFTLGLMWCPAVSALLTLAVCGGQFSSLGWTWGKTRYQVLSYLIPLAYASVAYLIAWSTGLAGIGNPEFLAGVAQDYGWTNWPDSAVVIGYVVLQATVGMIPSCAHSLGEEIGWRGFLVPELSRFLSFPVMAVVSGLIWAAWHYPLVLFADYNSGTPAWYALTCFSVLAVGISFPFAWMRLRSGSVWTAMILHGSHNMFIQTVFDRFTSDTGVTRYITGEFGLMLALVGIVVGVVCMRVRTLVEAVPDSESSAGPPAEPEAVPNSR
jgi:membrane protease YdiL (CAAX protease family)